MHWYHWVVKSVQPAQISDHSIRNAELREASARLLRWLKKGSGGNKTDWCSEQQWGNSVCFCHSPFLHKIIVTRPNRKANHQENNHTEKISLGLVRLWWFVCNWTRRLAFSFNSEVHCGHSLLLSVNLDQLYSSDEVYELLVTIQEASHYFEKATLLITLRKKHMCFLLTDEESCSTESHCYSGFAQKPPSHQENQKKGNYLHVTLVRRQ